MQCEKCGAQLPEDASNCRECGASLVSVPTGSSKKNPMIYAMMALAVIAVIALLAALFFKGKPTTVAVSPDATSAKPVTTATAPAPPPPAPMTQGHTPQVQKIPEPQKQQVPPEVLEYIEHIRQIEAQKQALFKDQGKALALASAGQADSLSQLFDMAMDPAGNQELPDPFKPVREELSRQVTNWQILIRNFDSKQPVPQPCGQLAGAYRWSITAEAAAIHKIATIMADVSENSRKSMTDALAQLQSMRKDPQLQRNIDKAVETADQNLAALCKQYNIPKPFDILKEQGGGSLVGF